MPLPMASDEKVQDSEGRVHASIKSLEHKWRVLIVVAGAMLITAIDSSVVNLALPIIGADFNLPLSRIAWVNVLNFATITGLLLSLGRLADLYGRRRMYIAGLAGFTVSSLLCGFAPDLYWLLLFRILQGVAAALLFANSMAIATENFPTDERGRALGIMAGTIGVGLAVGPLLGGTLLDLFSWRFVFWISVPVGVFATLLAFRVIPHDKHTADGATFDYAGAVLLLAGLFALIIGTRMFDPAGDLLLPVLVLGTGGVLLIVFVLQQNRIESPLLDLSLFRISTFSAGSLVILFGSLAIMVYVLLLPFFMLDYALLGPALAGLLMTTDPLTAAVVGPLSGRFSDRVGSKPLVISGLLIISLAMIVLNRLTINATIWQIAISIALIGLGAGLFYSPNNSALLGSVPHSKLGIATSMSSTMRNLGMTLGITLISAYMAGKTGDAFMQGFRSAFIFGLMMSLVALLAAVLGLRSKSAA